MNALAWPKAAPHHAGASANAINVMSDVASIVNSVLVMLILISFFVLSHFFAAQFTLFNIASDGVSPGLLQPSFFQVALCLFPRPLSKRNGNSPCLVHNRLVVTFFEK
jgi:hypothetical protein